MVEAHSVPGVCRLCGIDPAAHPVGVVGAGGEDFSVSLLLSLLRARVDQAVCMLQEFEPWFKWLIMDAVLAYVVGVSARKWLRLASFYQAIGWT